MARKRASLIYIGIRHSVVALDRKSGEIAWATKLAGSYFVNVFRDGEGLFATANGEIFALNPADGAILWHNKLKGFGTGYTTIASDVGASSGSATMAASTSASHAATAAAVSAAMIAAT